MFQFISGYLKYFVNDYFSRFILSTVILINIYDVGGHYMYNEVLHNIKYSLVYTIALDFFSYAVILLVVSEFIRYIKNITRVTIYKSILGTIIGLSILVYTGNPRYIFYYFHVLLAYSLIKDFIFYSDNLKISYQDEKNKIN